MFLGVGLHHLSNGSLFGENPGTEFLALYLSVPFRLASTRNGPTESARTLSPHEPTK